MFCIQRLTTYFDLLVPGEVVDGRGVQPDFHRYRDHVKVIQVESDVRGLVALDPRLGLVNGPVGL